RSPPVAEGMLEAVPDQDDREQITNTTDFPWRCICFLIATAPDGTQWAGTGWLAGPRVVITAGHVVYYPEQADLGGWANQVEVYPGHNGSNAPYRYVSSEFRSVTGWTSGQDSDADYGAILLPESTPLGFFGYAALADSDLHNILV